MAKPYKEGMGWAYRLRVAGQDVYRAGFQSKAAAQRDMEKLRIEYTDGPSPSGLGPVWAWSFCADLSVITVLVYLMTVIAARLA